MGDSVPGRAGYMLAGFAPGQVVAGYRLEEQIGAGGMAVVFRALDDRLGRRVALKVLAPALAADEGFRKRFIRESRAAAAVDDPHIIPVYEAGQAGGVLYIAMRLVPGRDVRTLLAAEGPLPASRVAAILSPVASALDAAHAAGLVHRDVKPANMLLDAKPGRPDHVYLSDFGLSKGAATSAGLTGLGQILGTPGYISPEQIQGAAVDGRADQYALGCAAFELLTGTPPFERDQPAATIWAHLSEPPPSACLLRPGLASPVDAAVAKAMAKRPDDRFGSCKDFAEALRSALGLASYSTGPQAIPAPRHPPAATARPRDASIGLAGHAAAAGQPTAVAAGSARGHAPAGPAAIISTGQSTVTVTRSGAACDLSGDELEVAAVTFSPDGGTLAVGSMAGRAYLCAAATGQAACDLTGPVAKAVPAPAGTQAIAGVTAIAYRPDGSLLAVGCTDGITRLWDTDAAQVTAILQNPGSAGTAALAFEPDGELLAAGDDNGCICLWDVAGNRVAAALTAPSAEGVLAAAFSPDGSVLAVADASGCCYLWHARRRELAAVLDHRGCGEVFCLAFTGDGSVLATGDSTGRICLWDPDDAELISVLRSRRRTSAVYDIAFSPKTLELAAGYAQGGISLWDPSPAASPPPSASKTALRC